MKNLVVLLIVTFSTYAQALECFVESTDKFDAVIDTQPLPLRKTSMFGDLKYFVWDSQEQGKVLVQVIQSANGGRGPDFVVAEADSIYPSARLFVRLASGESKTVKCK